MDGASMATACLLPCMATHMEAVPQVAEPVWYAVQVWSGREHVSEKHLRLRGYEVLLPLCLERRRWSDRVKVINRALFSGYLFCRVDGYVAERIVTAPGVIRIVGNESGPMAVAPNEIEAIQRMVENHLSVEPCTVPRVGQRVRIEGGPLCGVEAIVVVVKNRRRLVVSVSLLKRAVAVEISSEWITVPHFDRRDLQPLRELQQ